MLKKAVFFDRDGVLNVDKGPCRDFKQIELYPECGDVIALCKNHGFMIFIVTNQTVIARGLSTIAELHNLHEQYQKAILRQNSAALIDEIFFCPHHPNANLAAYRKICKCRKPKPGMLLAAKKKYNLDLSSSYMVGDRHSDIIAGQMAGCSTVQVLSGKHCEGMIETDLEISTQIKPDHTIQSLNDIKFIC